MRQPEIPAPGKICLYKSRDGGKTFEPLEDHDLLSEREHREGRTERILPGNLVRLRRIDKNINIALAALLSENNQLQERLSLLQKDLSEDALGDIIEARIKRVIEPYLGDT